MHSDSYTGCEPLIPGVPPLTFQQGECFTPLFGQVFQESCNEVDSLALMETRNVRYNVLVTLSHSQFGTYCRCLLFARNDLVWILCAQHLLCVELMKVQT